MSAVDPLTAGLNLGDDLINAISKAVPDPNARADLIAKIQQQAVQTAQASDSAQIDVEKAEIQAPNWYDKPHLSLMWVCIAGVVFDIIIVPWAMWIAYSLGYPIPKPPVMLTDQLGTLLLGVFGLGGLNVGGKVVQSWTEK